MMHTTLALLDNLGFFAIFLVALGLIIFVHELGHFMTAKWVGIKVEQFAIGFGHVVVAWRKGLGLRFGSTKAEVERRVNEHLHRLNAPKREKQEHYDLDAVRISRTEKTALPDDPKLVDRAMQELGIGETEYSIRWFPLGGYVKMLGQDDLDPTKVSPDPRAYNRKPIWARMIVVSAGVIMNLIFAVVFFIAAFMWGVKFPPAIVGGVVAGSPAAQAVAVNDEGASGLRPGDRIVSINGEAVDDFNEIRINTALAPAGQPLEMQVRRPAYGDQPERTLRFRMEPKFNDQKFLQIGVEQAAARTVGGDVEADRDEAQARLAEYGLKPGMTLTAVNGETVEGQWQYLLAIENSNGSPIAATFTDEDGRTVDVDVRPVSQLQLRIDEQAGTATRHMLGFVPATVVESTAKGFPAHDQLKAGDIIKAINGVPWPDSAQFQKAVAESGSEVSLTVLRDGESIDLTVARRPKNWGLFGRKLIGVGYRPAFDRNYVVAALPGSPAAELNLVPGTRLTAVDGQPIQTMSDLRRIAQADDDGRIEVSFTEPLAGGSPGSAELTLDEDTRAALGELAWIDPIGVWKERLELQKTNSPLEALAIGYDRTVLFLQQTYVTMARLFQGSVPAKGLTGPVGITHAGMTMAERGFSYLFWFMGLISVNLAVINFLPLPIVDGGLFVMLIIEKLRGKPLPLAIQSAITMAGLVLLGAVALYVTFNDIQRLLGG